MMTDRSPKQHATFNAPMNATQAASLATRLREAFPAWGWTDLRHALYAENFRRYAYAPAFAVVEHLVQTWASTQAPAIGKITEQIEQHLDRARRLEEHRRDQKLLAGPRDPEVQKLLRGCIERLSAKPGAQALAAPPEREQPSITDRDALRSRAAAKRRIRAQARAYEA